MDQLLQWLSSNQCGKSGVEAIGQNAAFTPGGVTQIGFDIFFAVLDQSSVWSPVDSTAGIILGIIILGILALVGVNLLLLFISGLGACLRRDIFPWVRRFSLDFGYGYQFLQNRPINRAQLMSRSYYWHR